MNAARPKVQGSSSRLKIALIAPLVALAFLFGLAVPRLDPSSSPPRRILAQSGGSDALTAAPDAASLGGLVPFQLVWKEELAAKMQALHASAAKSAEEAQAAQQRAKDLEAAAAKSDGEAQAAQQHAQQQEAAAAKAVAEAQAAAQRVAEMEAAVAKASEEAGAAAQRAAALEAAAAQAKMAGRIPKILHTVFITTDPQFANLTMWPHHVAWVTGCKQHFSAAAGWTQMYWDAAASERLVAEHYPHFLDFYRENVTLANEKSDMVRYLVLHKYGGLYLDSDTDCWREAGDTLEGADVILQGSHDGEGVGSAAIASVPGAPIWARTLEMVRQRSLEWLANQQHPSWYKSLEFTGPNLLRDAIKASGVASDEKNMFPFETTTADGLVYRVNPGGSWFLACQWFEGDCRKRVYQERALGHTDMKTVVGMHRFSGSWIQGREDGKRVVTCEEAQ